MNIGRLHRITLYGILQVIFHNLKLHTIFEKELKVSSCFTDYDTIGAKRKT